MVHIVDDVLASIDHGDEILEIMAGVVVAMAPVAKSDIFGREESGRRDQFHAGVRKLLFGCRGQRFLEPRRVESEMRTVRRHDVDRQVAEHPTTRRRAFALVMIESNLADPRLHVGIPIGGHDFEDDVDVSVRRAGDQVRVTAQLSVARTEEGLWRNAYDKTLTNVFSIQAELAKDIAQALKTALSPEEKTLVERRPTTSTAAYEQFLKAREARRNFGNATENARTMEPFLLEAVRLDPNYAAAYAELVYVYTTETAAADRQARLAKAKEAVDQARRLAPDSPEVILALGDYYLGAGDTARALEHYERFGRLRPKDPDYLGRLAETYQQLGAGWQQKTLELRRQLEDVDPGNLANLYRTVNLLTTGRRYAESIAVQRRILARVPDNPEARHYIGEVTFYLNGSTQLQEQFWSGIKPEAWERGKSWRHRWLRSQGKLDDVVSFDLADSLAGDAESINMAIVHAARGNVVAARARLADLPERLRSRAATGGAAANNRQTWIQLGTIEGVLGSQSDSVALDCNLFGAAFGSPTPTCRAPACIGVLFCSHLQSPSSVGQTFLCYVGQSSMIAFGFLAQRRD